MNTTKPVARILLLAMVCLGLHGIVAGAQQYQWDVASGNWHTPANWRPTRNTPQSSDWM